MWGVGEGGGEGGRGRGRERDTGRPDRQKETDKLRQTNIRKHNER